MYTLWPIFSYLLFLLSFSFLSCGDPSLLSGEDFENSAATDQIQIETVLEAEVESNSKIFIYMQYYQHDFVDKNPFDPDGPSKEKYLGENLYISSVGNSYWKTAYKSDSEDSDYGREVICQISETDEVIVDQPKDCCDFQERKPCLLEAEVSDHQVVVYLAQD